MPAEAQRRDVGARKRGRDEEVALRRAESERRRLEKEELKLLQHTIQ